MNRKRMNDADKTRYLESVERRVGDPKVLALVKEDIDFGLTQAEIDDYVNRSLKLGQRKAISEMYRRGYSGKAIGIIGATDIDAEKMRVAMQLYEQNVPVNKIKEVLDGTRTARDMQEVFDLALKKAQEAAASVPKEQAQEASADGSLERLSEIVRQLAETVAEQTKSFGMIADMQKKMESIRVDEAAGNHDARSEKLEKENRELAEQLNSRQDEITKGLQAISKLREEMEKKEKEMAKLREHINELEKKGAEQAVQEKAQTVEESAQTGEESAQTTQEDAQPAIPVHYTMAAMRDGKAAYFSEIEPVRRKPSAMQNILSMFALRRKSQRDLVQMVVKRELSPEQVNEIKKGLAQGLDEEQMQLIISKDLSPERIKSIVDFAVLQNRIKQERG